MGSLCCCCRSSTGREPSALIKKDDSSHTSATKSYGAISTQELEPDKRLQSASPRKSPTELLYSEPPQSARVKSADETSDTAPLVKSTDASVETNKSEKKTLAKIARLTKKVSSAFPTSSARTSTPNPTVQNDTNTKAEDFSERPVDVPSETATVNKCVTVTAGSWDSMEYDTCHSIGKSSDEDESEDARIFRMMTSSPGTVSVTSAGSETQLVSETPSPGSSALDVSKDATGKKSKAKGFMKKAGHNMKKAKKKVGKGMGKMLTRDKKSKDEEKRKTLDVTERPRTASSASANESSSSGAQFKRVTSDRMKSKHARERLAALEKKRAEDANQRAAAQGFTDPREAALERGEKLSELEDKTSQMREHAASFAHNVSLLKNHSTSPS